MLSFISMIDIIIKQRKIFVKRGTHIFEKFTGRSARRAMVFSGSAGLMDAAARHD